MPQIFAEPGRLWLLVFVGFAALVVARGSFRRRSDWSDLGVSGDPPSAGTWLWWGAAGCLILALAGPRWGREPGSEPLPGHDVVLLVDVSRSMGAEDAVPNRLGLAVAAARSLLKPLQAEPGDRVAIVAFAGRAVVRCPLTENLDAVNDRLAELRPGAIEPGGTDLGAGLAAALTAFDDVEHADGRSIVVFSDGEDHAETWPSVVGSLVTAAIPVHVVAIGDSERSSPVPSAARTGPSVPASSSPAMTRRMDRALTQLAHATGGASIPLGVTPTDLGALYRDSIQPTAREHRPSPRFSERAERSSVFIGAALVAGVWGAWPQPRRRFHRHSIRSRWGASWRQMVVAILIVLGIVLSSLAAGPAAPLSPAARATMLGLQAYRDQRFADAVTLFGQVLGQDPGNPVGPFNLGAALFAAHKYEEARNQYESARSLALAQSNQSLAAKADFALGNCSAMLSEYAVAIGHYDTCIASTSQGDDLESVRADAAVNRAFLLAKLEPPKGSPEPEGQDQRSPADDPPPSGTNSKQRSRSKSPPTGQPQGGDQSPNDPSGTRGAGGAGGSEAAPPRLDRPEDRLEAALQRIRAAKEKSPFDDPPPDRPPNQVPSDKDW